MTIISISNPLIVLHVRNMNSFYRILVRCTHEDRVQFNKAVIDLVVADYKTINGNGRANFCKNLQMEECPKILTIADKQKAKFNWKFDEMDKNR